MRCSTSWPRMVSWFPEVGSRRRRARSWDVADLLLAGEAFVVAVSVPVLMRLPVERLARVLGHGRRRAPGEGAARMRRDREQVLRVTDAVLRRGRPIVRTGCLTRAVTRYWCLERAGDDVELCFGVARIGGEVESHCWVRAPEGPIREPDEASAFRELFRIGADGLTEMAAP